MFGKVKKLKELLAKAIETHIGDVEMLTGLAARCQALEDENARQATLINKMIDLYFEAEKLYATPDNVMTGCNDGYQDCLERRDGNESCRGAEGVPGDSS